MIALIERDVRIALEVEASLEEANALVNDKLQGTNFYGADCFNSISRSQALFLSLTLAKLFELPKPQKKESSAHRYKRSDVASIPLLIYFLDQTSFQDSLTDRAYDWTSGLLGIEHARACHNAIIRAVTTYRSFETSNLGSVATLKLSKFRNKILAHTLLGDSQSALPTYGELFLLVDIARDVTNDVIFAINGHNVELQDYENERKRVSKAFWEAALMAAASSK